MVWAWLRRFQPSRILKAKKSAFPPWVPDPDLIARVILERAGLNPAKDVEVVAAGLSPSRALAISKNLVQGAPLSPEVAAEAQKLGIKILEVKPVPVVTDLIMTTRSFIRREEDTVAALHEGLRSRNPSFCN